TSRHSGRHRQRGDVAVLEGGGIYYRSAPRGRRRRIADGSGAAAGNPAARAAAGVTHSAIGRVRRVERFGKYGLCRTVRHIRQENIHETAAKFSTRRGVIPDGISGNRRLLRDLACQRSTLRELVT